MVLSFLKLLFPPRCVSCRGQVSSDLPLCPSCTESYEREKRLLCRRCGRVVSSCQCRPRYEENGVLCYLSVFSYQKNGCGGKMILALKDRKDRRIARLLGKDMAKVLQNGCILEEGAIVTFVPRSRETVLSKGVDQARVLAKETAEALGLEMAPCLSSNDVGVAQKELSAVKREEAADEKYVLSKKAPPLAGRQVILVDDVLTTGATLGACARLLKQAGARTVICLTAGKR